MKLIKLLIAISLVAIGLSACETQGPANTNQIPLMKPERPASPAAAISGGSGAMHSGMNSGM